MGWGLWLWWVVASTVGFAGGRYAGMAVGKPEEIIVAGYTWVGVGWIGSAVLQWLALRRRLVNAGGWVLAGVVGAAVAGAVVFGAGAVNADVGWVAGAILLGPAVGFLQWWLVLRGQIAHTGWWVLVSAVGWFGAMFFSAPLGWLALGPLYGAITGLALVKLLRRSPGTARAQNALCIPPG